MLIDDNWVSIGSANFDPLSFFHNDELNVLIAENKLITDIEQFFVDGFGRSKNLTLRDLKHRSLKEKLFGRFMLLFFWQL